MKAQEEERRILVEEGKFFAEHLLNPFTNEEEMKLVFMRPVPKAIGMLQCTIHRDKKGFARFFPKYTLTLSEGGRFLLNGKKRSARTSNYMITYDQKCNRKGAGYLGKLRSNFLGTEFNIYDWGENPKKKIMDDKWRT